MDTEYITWGALAVIVSRELYQWMKGSAKDLIKATDANTKALIELRVHIDYLLEQIKGLPKIREDINEAHAKIREIRAAQNGKGK